MNDNGESRGISNGAFHAGDRVLVTDAPSWCRRHVQGKRGYVTRVLPFDEEPLVWIRFDPPIPAWCPSMDALDVFPFAAGQLKSLAEEEVRPSQLVRERH